jgi:hypothetical protein
MFDIAVHPMLMDSECGCVWSLPLSSNGLVMVSGIDERSDICSSVHNTDMDRHDVTLLQTQRHTVLEWKRDRWVSAPHAC